LRRRILEIAEGLLSRPSAPFREGPVREYIRQFCELCGIGVRQDGMGNVIATYGGGYADSGFAFAAHMDHPGFIVERDSRRGGTTALFYGSVGREYFRGAKVRVFGSDGEVKGRVTKTEFYPRKDMKRIWLMLDGRVKRGDLAMWDVAGWRIRGDRIYSRACDDLIGCAAILGMFEQLRRKRVRKKVTGIFTVAEEAGLQGAKYLGLGRGVPRATNIISIEASRELASGRIGDGAVIRVGDRRSIFDPAFTGFIVAVAEGIKRQDRFFKYQRKLMDGGTCESSIYQAFGYRTAALCVCLGNYHNCNFRTKKIAAEYISTSDLAAMVELMAAMVKQSGELAGFVKGMPPAYREHRGKLGERLFLER
jgi:endoglucanase